MKEIQQDLVKGVGSRDGVPHDPVRDPYPHLQLEVKLFSCPSTAFPKFTVPLLSKSILEPKLLSLVSLPLLP